MSSIIISSPCKIKWFWLTSKNVLSFDVAFLHPLVEAFPPFFLAFIGNPVDLEKPYPTAKIDSFPPLEKPVFFRITYLILGERKVSLIALRQVLPKVLLVAWFFSYTIMTYLKKLDGTMSLDTKQCPAGIYPRYLLFYKNVPSFDVALLNPTGVDCPSFFWNYMRNPGNGRKSYPTAKNLIISPTRKSLLLHSYFLLSKVSLLPHEIAILK